MTQKFVRVTNRIDDNIGFRRARGRFRLRRPGDQRAERVHAEPLPERLREHGVLLTQDVRNLQAPAQLPPAR